jgi:hypothetical protein
MGEVRHAGYGRPTTGEDAADRALYPNAKHESAPSLPSTPPTCDAQSRRAARALVDTEGPRLHALSRCRAAALLQVAWLKPSVLGDAREHPRPQLLAFPEGERVVGPTWATQDAMGATQLALDPSSTV